MSFINVHKSVSNQSLEDWIDDLFNRSLSDVIGSDFTVTRPSVNITDTDEAYRVEVAAPGFRKSDFEVKIEKRQLFIRGQRDEGDTQSGRFTRREFNYASFSRQFDLPESADADTISAQYKNGVLTVRVAKKAATEAPSKVVEIK